jgi:hypothetical protein
MFKTSVLVLVLVLCCAVLCCAVLLLSLVLLHRAVPCRAVPNLCYATLLLCCAPMRGALRGDEDWGLVLCCAVLCCAVLC